MESDFSFHKCSLENILERSPICPHCESKYLEIHGWIFPVGDPAGHKCDHTWHKGLDYDPSQLHLTKEDEAFLADLKVSI